MSDSYEAQLRSLFEAECPESGGRLGRASLASLCKRLELEGSQAEELIGQLLQDRRVPLFFLKKGKKVIISMYNLKLHIPVCEKFTVYYFYFFPPNRNG